MSCCGSSMHPDAGRLSTRLSSCCILPRPPAEQQSSTCEVSKPLLCCSREVCGCLG